MSCFRADLSASTISRIETGKRTIGLDVLVPLARALQIDLDVLLDDVDQHDDDVIRPVATSHPGHTVWLLSRPTGATSAMKMRVEPNARRHEPRVHPGHDWFFVLEGRVLVVLGEREIVGEAAEFSIMTPPMRPTRWRARPRS